MTNPNKILLYYKKSEHMSPKTKTHIFPNGFKCIYEFTGHSIPLTCIYVFVKFGSIHETTPSQKGIAHFIEHMCFKGTKSIEKPIDIVTTFDEMGAFFNAETSKQYTCYKIRCRNENVQQAIYVVSDMILNSVFRAKEIDLERHVVKEETLRLADDPTNDIDSAIYKTLYAGTQYEDPVDDIRYHTHNSLQANEVKRLYHNFYQPHNMGISIISTIPFSTIKNILQHSSFMTTHKPTQIISHPQFPPTNHGEPIYTLITKKGVKTAHISITFRTCPYGHKDMYTLYLLKNIMGGYMSSRLFMILREKWGLTYTSKCFVSHQASSGHFEIYTMCDPSKITQRPGVLSLIFDIIDDFLIKEVHQKELDIAKGNFKGQFILSLEESQTKCIHNGVEYILYDKERVDEYESLYDRYYKSVTKKDIMEVARRYFRPENMLVCLVGEKLPPLASIKQISTTK